MHKRTLALIIILILVAGGLLAIALNTPSVTAPTKLQVTPTVVQPAQETSLLFDNLSMIPSSSSAAKATYSLPIKINTNRNVVTAVQLELLYDPETLTNIAINQGDFFVNPVSLLNKIDPKNGRISYALGISPTQSGRQGIGIVATLTFQAKTLTPKPTSISFLPKTLVTAEGVGQSVLKSTNSAQFIMGR